MYIHKVTKGVLHLNSLRVYDEKDKERFKKTPIGAFFDFVARLYVANIFNVFHQSLFVPSYMVAGLLEYSQTRLDFDGFQ